MPSSEPRPDAESVARLFHECYERLAGTFGYETRRDSAVPWDDVPAKNQALMIATCEEVLAVIRARPSSEPRPTRCDEYRDLLETWAAWWNGPGRQGYRDPVIPPITATGKALACSICAGESSTGERCAACGRRL